MQSRRPRAATHRNRVAPAKHVRAKAGSVLCAATVLKLEQLAAAWVHHDHAVVWRGGLRGVQAAVQQHGHEGLAVGTTPRRVHLHRWPQVHIADHAAADQHKVAFDHIFLFDESQRLPL